MQQSSRLVPCKLKAQCNAAIMKLQADNMALDLANNSLDNFIDDGEIKSESFDALKQKVSDYKLVIRAMKLANECSKELKNAEENVNKILTESGEEQDFVVE